MSRISKWMGFTGLLLLVSLGIFVGFAKGENFLPYLNGAYIEYTGDSDKDGYLTIQINDFRDLPYDYAKQLPPEVYYWWALEHNIRQEEKVVRSSSSVFQIRENTSVIDTKSHFWPGRNGTTTFRSFNSQISNGPVTIYNPYFR